MIPFGVTIPVTIPQRSEFLEGLMNYPVFSVSYKAMYLWVRTVCSFRKELIIVTMAL